MKKITPHLHQLNLGFVNAFLIEDIVPGPGMAAGLASGPDTAAGLVSGFTLVDTGMPGQLPKIFAQMKRPAKTPATSAGLSLPIPIPTTQEAPPPSARHLIFRYGPMPILPGSLNRATLAKHPYKSAPAS